jgi:hypothetical protein
MNEQFEKWYCEKYWNFKGVTNRQVFFNDGKYNHLDVDLAYNSWLSSAKSTSREIMRMVARQKLCHDDEFLLLSAIREEFAVEI